MTDQQVAAYFGKEIAPEVRYLKVGDRTIRYLWQNLGHQTTVILVHGAPGSSSAFIDFFHNDHLSKKVNLISIDRLGYGYSGYGQAEPVLERQAAAVNAIVTHLDLDHVILVGHSIGAPIVAKASFDLPSRYAGLVLVAGSVDPEQEPLEWYRPWLRNWLAKLILPPSLYVTNEEIYQLKGQLEAMEPYWNKIDFPVIVIQGESDRLVPKENAKYIEEKVSAELLEVWLEPDVNHFIPWNRPDLIINSILKLEGKL